MLDIKTIACVSSGLNAWILWKRRPIISFIFSILSIIYGIAELISLVSAL